MARYYLGQGAGQWRGRGASRLGLEGSVEARDLAAVLRGCDPSSGSYLPRVRSPRRRAGWDLVFAAPKSLSLLAATASGDQAVIEAGHRQAVVGVFDHLQRESGKDLIAASFAHSTNAGGEPHVHTHVLLANLVPGTGGWSALGAWLHRDELAGLYHLGLRHHIERAGWGLDWRIRADGLPDLAAVPRAAVRAASTRGHESRVGLAYSGRSGPARDWAAAAGDAGWGADQAYRAAARNSPASPPLGAASLEARVTSKLLAGGSTFTRRDVVVALSATSSTGLEANAASAWADAFCNQAIPARAVGNVARWTTPLAREADRRVAELIERRVESGVGKVVDGAEVEAALADDAGFSPQSAAAVRALMGGHAVQVIGCEPGRSNFVAEATIIDACSSAWEAGGIRVAVAARSSADASRWAALTGVEMFHPSRRPDVLLVDQADRRPPGELMALLCSAPDAKLVFIEGGTCPRSRVDASLGYNHAAAMIEPVEPGEAPSWTVPRGRPVDPLSTDRAAGQLLGRWAETFGRADLPSPVMVGLGVPEVLALNDAARSHLREIGHLAGPSINAGGRSFQAGDQVIAIRAGAGLRSGTPGTVLEVNPRRGSVTIGWPNGRAADLRRQSLGSIGHGYATTPAVASRMEGPVFVLGRAEGLGLDRARVAAAISVERRNVGRGLDRDRRQMSRELW